MSMNKDNIDDKKLQLQLLKKETSQTKELPYPPTGHHRLDWLKPPH